MFKSTYILRRFSAANEDGCHPYEDFPVRLNVQSLNAKELQALPEGTRPLPPRRAWPLLRLNPAHHPERKEFL